MRIFSAMVLIPLSLRTEVHIAERATVTHRLGWTVRRLARRGEPASPRTSPSSAAARSSSRSLPDDPRVGDADAGRAAHREVGADCDRRGQGAVDALHEVVRVRVVRLVDDHELVAAEAGDDVGATQRSTTAAGRSRTARQSPASWPWVSLTFLRPSRSRNATASGRPLR